MSFHFLFIPFEQFDYQSEFLALGSCPCELLDIIDAINAKRIDTLSICEMHNHANDYLDIGRCISFTAADKSIITVKATIHNPNTISKIQHGVLTGFSIKFDSEKHHIVEIALIDAPTFQDDSTLSPPSTNDEPSAEDLELFIKSVTHRRLLYLWMLRARGYQVNDEEIARLEVELYPNLQEIDSQDGCEISQKDVDELQLQLSLTDPQPNTGSSFEKAILFRLEQTTVRMRKENNHSRPHFHIQYKNQYSASYAVDNFELLAGNMPAKYEKPILDWAARNQKSLRVTWGKLQAGDDVRELVSAENQA
jgi:hypothetical protein